MLVNLTFDIISEPPSFKMEIASNAFLKVHSLMIPVSGKEELFSNTNPLQVLFKSHGRKTELFALKVAPLMKVIPAHSPK